jgi:hypothetical protein
MHLPPTRLDTANSRRLGASLAAVICTAVIAACGSSQPAGTGAGGGPLLVYAQCMRAHGVPNLPDPSAGGGLVIPNDINTESPAFLSAQHACGNLAQGGGPAGSSGSRKLELLALARCMRAHGVPDFADPTSSPPPPSGGNAIGGDGTYLSLGTAGERRSPTYKRAAAACRLTIP